MQLSARVLSWTAHDLKQLLKVIEQKTTKELDEKHRLLRKLGARRDNQLQLMDQVIETLDTFFRRTDADIQELEAEFHGMDDQNYSDEDLRAICKVAFGFLGSMEGGLKPISRFTNHGTFMGEMKKLYGAILFKCSQSYMEGRTKLKRFHEEFKKAKRGLVTMRTPTADERPVRRIEVHDTIMDDPVAKPRETVGANVVATLFGEEDGGQLENDLQDDINNGLSRPIKVENCSWQPGVKGRDGPKVIEGFLWVYHHYDIDPAFGSDVFTTMEEVIEDLLESSPGFIQLDTYMFLQYINSQFHKWASGKNLQLTGPNLYLPFEDAFQDRVEEPLNMDCIGTENRLNFGREYFEKFVCKWKAQDDDNSMSNGSGGEENSSSGAGSDEPMSDGSNDEEKSISGASYDDEG